MKFLIIDIMNLLDIVDDPRIPSEQTESLKCLLETVFGADIVTRLPEIVAAIPPDKLEKARIEWHSIKVTPE